VRAVGRRLGTTALGSVVYGVIDRPRHAPSRLPGAHLESASSVPRTLFIAEFVPRGSCQTRSGSPPELSHGAHSTASDDASTF
jgi:hypothetical protein